MWQDNNANRYDYRFDANQRLTQCTAFEQTSSYGVYPFNQSLTYTKEGLLERVRDQEDSSRYHYRNGRLASIDFFQEGKSIYRYLVSTNEQGIIVGLRGVPLNDSGLLGYTTRYQLDEQGRYVQLDVEDDRGKLYYRVKQTDFVSANGHLYGLMQGVPYDLNRYPWLDWGEGFPLSPYLASHTETYRYAAPETPSQLIKRADESVTWQRDKLGHVTGQFHTDVLTTIQDTVLIHYINCH
ncbi:hypothetical protein SD10_02270 [Spirosoma radiotolerans]|uniref:Uncharacterized protein n=2 Tax=Spirosoma radiotolerans TaxID=1379870 RepID=A0A0E3V5S2_9BACT|nr:hypothetical protein SD10_02270 [Spirosoma radiotolerans]